MNKKEESLSFTEACATWSYDRKTGELRWLISTRNTRVGDVAGTCSPRQRRFYLVVTLRGFKYLGHRLAWLIETGEWPKGKIDHIDQNGLNNRIKNLRDTDQKTNCRNMRRSLRNKSGATGVFEYKGFWVARISSDSGEKYLGKFKDKASAIKSRKDAERKMGYHKNHGRKKD